MLLPFGLPASLPGTWTTATSEKGGSEGTLHQVTSVCNAAEARIISQYRESPLLLALLCSLLHPAQHMELGTAQVYERVLDIDLAEGGLLDRLGKIVREAREGRLDPEYRRAIRTRILINRSQGRIPDLIEIVRLFDEIDSETGAYVRIREPQPGTIEVRSDRTPINDATSVDRRLRRAKAAGVRLHTITLTGTRTTALRLVRASVYPEKNTATGLASASVAVTGGHLAHVLDR